MRWLALCIGAGAICAVGLACGLDMEGLAETADGGLETPDADAAASEGASTEDSGTDVAEGADAGAADVGETADAQPEASTGDEPPPPPVDSGCSGVICNGACSIAPDCSTCANGENLLCPSTRTCATDCGNCPSSPIECFACDVNRANPIGTCQPDDPNAYCLNTDYAGIYGGGMGYHCGCTTSADCLGNTEACISVGGTSDFGCFTCGESYTQGATCNNGGKCNANKAVCN